MRYYNCFSLNQMKFLLNNGQVPIGIKTHTRTKNTFWIFEKNNDLDKLLTQWTYSKAN